MKNILVTGATGYIGSHTCIELLNKGYNVIAVDNLCNSSIKSLHSIQNICQKKVTFYEEDINNKSAIVSIFNKHKIDSVIHFAGLKSVGESNEKPLSYYQNNLSGTISLCNAMNICGIRKIIFSSSATVYGQPKELPIPETASTGTTNTYGNTKLLCETFLKDLTKSQNNKWQVTLLRYFNPGGAHISGEIGESPRGIPNNLLPYILQVAQGKLSHLNIYGDDYETADGTGIRDYIHISDLSAGHLAALQKMEDEKMPYNIYNLGTGRGYSVLEIITNFENISGKKIPYKITGRRQGDIDACYANSNKAKQKLNWQTKKDINDIIADSWRWSLKHPNGF